MIFNKTDISVVNEFLDPEVVQRINGNLTGALDLTGTLLEPKLIGKVDFNNGMANVSLLGSNVYFDGEIESVKDGFYINQMPIRDKDGNTGFITGSLFHSNFSNFFFELVFNLEEHPTKRMPNDPSRPLPVERFLVMNKEYDVESPYYGDAYITGVATISGYTDNLTVDVNAETKRGTRIFFPMYGPTTIEEEGFITFKEDDIEEEIEKKVDLTGVDLLLSFDVTDDATVKLIFDEKIGDEITAKGSGDIKMSVNRFNELQLDGTYIVSEGDYNFVMGPYKQKFNIAPGGTVQWTGSPYDAMLDIEAYYRTTANLGVVMPNVLESETSTNETVLSYLYLKGDMNNPEISFDVKVPNASESGKATLARIRSNQDELNKQFFSILISKSFIPISGQGGSGGNGGAFLDLASSQINGLLNKVSDNYQLNVNLERDNYLGKVSGEFGVSKGFLNEKLIVSGSFGVGYRTDESKLESNAPAQNSLIGDVKVEYLLNDPGTFRVTAYNESNDNTLIQNNARGQFTQGVGISYKEDFHTLEDFKIFQFFANTFRKREDWVIVRSDNSNRAPIPENYKSDKGIKE